VTRSTPTRDALSMTDLPARAGETRIICLGLSALDQIWRVDQLFGGGSEKIKGVEYVTIGGGMAANAAVTVSRLGGRSMFWGRGGADAAGLEMRRAFEADGVDVAQFRLFPEGASSVSGIIIDAAGERQIVNFRGRFPETADWLRLEQVATASAVLADPRWVAGAVAMFGAARLAGVPTVLDADVADEEVFRELLPLSDHAVFSEPALTRFAGSALEDALARVAGFGCRVAAVTRGGNGVTWRVDGKVQSAPAFAVNAIDTIGAGDVFHGAYAFAVGAGLPLDDIIAFASAAAALKCTRRGARAGIPTLQDCLAFQRNN
jgi:sulfofructose kinase